LGRLLVWLLGQTVQRGLGPLAKDQAVRSALLSAAGAAPSFLGLDGAELAILAKELISGAGRGVVLAGAHLPAWIHALTAALNVSLGNEGSVLDSGLGINPPWCSSEREIRTALERAADGGGAVLISLLSNPAYALPQDLRFEDQAARIPLVVASCLTPDETAAIAGWVAPCAHDLESWGDSDWHVGTLTLRQPAIQPLFGARQWEESLLQWMPSPIRPAADYRAFLRDRWRTEVYPQTRSAADFNQFWAAALHDGLVETTPQAAGSSTVSSEAVLEAIAEAQVEERAGFDVVLTPGARMFDGRFADNGWLQELPHPVTSQVWGNGAVMSRDAAARLRCREGDLVRLSVAERTVTLPVVIEPGVCDEVISVELGYGRRASGAVGVAVGVDAGLLRSAAGGFSPWLYGGVEAASAGGAARVVRVQEHHNVEGRRIVVEGTLSVYRSRPDFVNLGNQSRSADYLHKWRYTGHKWGMAVDLNACIGCGACVTACMAENNTPVVGPDQVARGREMHWIRIDRYYRGPLDQPRTVFQPMLCQHCDYAPCEKVCPVAATVHSPEGLSEMVYNRCVGTRYCANNCPYKVRRFNFFNYHEGEASPRDLMYNPEVTLRSRGVMEKCTFCVQRIAAARQSARVERRALQDGELLTACQQACPTGAIVFGDLNNAESRVHRLTERRRGYRVIEEVGTRPAVTYLAKIRNPNPDVKA
jgi:molybdopterin-containing oxidoreductase family iron-sulfur binding subunit